jgi:O-antigen/teichoic acid export membrane protein
MKPLSIFNRVRSVIQTATVRDTGIVFAGNTISSVLGAVFYFLLARVAGPAQFGAFAAVAAVATTAVDLFDVGINAAIINYAARIETRSSSLRAAFARKVLISAVVTLIIVLAAPIISGLLGQPILTGAIRWAAILVPTKALFSFVRSGLQAAKLFAADAVLDILAAVIRLGGFGVFILGFDFNPIMAAIWAYAIGLFLPAGLALKKVREMMAKSDNNIKAPEFTSYQSYMTAAFGLSAISGRLDVFFLTRLTTLETVGLYQAAFRLFMPIQQLSGSLSRVLAPRFAGFGDKGEVGKYLNKSLLLSTGLSVSMFLTLPFFPWGIKLLYGSSFTAAVTNAYWLLVYFAVFLAATPWWAKLLYFHSNAKWYAVLAGGQLIMLLILMPILINIFGSNGAALALIGVNLAAAGMVAYLVRK